MGRPPLRREAEPIRDGNVRGKSRRRRPNDDKYAVPDEYKEPGTSYEWKRESVLGMETNVEHSYLSGQYENGWEPVPVSQMPKMGRESDGGVIRRDGLILCSRPAELTREARLEDYEIARNQVKVNEAKMMGTDPAEGLPNKGSSIRTAYDKMPSDHRVVRTATTQLTLDD